MRYLELLSLETEELFDMLRSEIDNLSDYPDTDTPVRRATLVELKRKVAWLLPGPCSRCRSPGCHPQVLAVVELPVCFGCLTAAELAGRA